MNIIRTASEENHLLQAALGYARWGWRVMPLHEIAEAKCSCGKDCGNSAGKHPRTRRGLKDATVDEQTINRWWADWPSANVGIATGPESGFFMIGPDGQAGIEALTELERQHGPLPPTALARSGGGGRHHYFTWPAEGGIRTGANYSGLPIDVRGSGGLVVAPPSLHKSGGRYAWEVPAEAVQLAEAPGWLLEWLRNGKGTGRRKKPDEETKETNESGPAVGVNSFVRSPAAVNGKPVFTVQADCGADVQARAIAYLEKCPSAVSGQGGHNQTFEVARAIVYGFGLGPDAGFDLLCQHYNPRCVPPWSEPELRHKCDDADAKPFDKRRGYLLHEDEQSGLASGPSPGNGGDGEDIEALPMPQPAPWPTLPPEALYGLAGEIVHTIEPQTESDPVAILGQLLQAVGNAVGRGPHFVVEGRKHHSNLYEVLVGKSAYGRKGTAQGRVEQVMEYADAGWCDNCQASGLGSGEGLITAVRDKVIKREPVRKGGRVVGYEDVEADPGVVDKRLLVSEAEFAQVLKVMQREGNTLSPLIRQAWDTGNLRTLVKNNPNRATGAHVSILGHITQVELLKLLRDTEAFNGFANRFLWLLVRRARLLPDGGCALDLSPLGTRLNYALAAARNVGAMTRDKAASGLWHEEYPRLTTERQGLYGAVTGRAEAQVLRLSMVYALLDASAEIKQQHVRAALALWSYADASARLIFGAEPEDPLIALVLAKLQGAGGAGMTKTDLHNAFSRNIPAAKLLEALAKLRDRGDAYSERAKTGRPGAPAERWFTRRRNEGNESPIASTPGEAAERVDSLNSFVRRPSPDNAADGKEVVTV